MLSESETEIAKQALWNYLPFSQMQCLHTITEFNLNCPSSEYTQRHHFRNLASEVSPCILSKDGRVLICATARYEIVIRDLVTDEELCKLQGHEAPVAYLALSEDRQFLASYSTDRKIKIWAIPDHS